LTIICALKTHDGVWIGADGRVCDDGKIVNDRVEKWCKNGHGLWLGIAGALRAINMAGTVFVNSEYPVHAIEGIRKLVEDDGWESEPGKGPKSYDFTMMITDGKSIWEVAGDGSWVQHRDIGDFVAIGSGADFAFGAYDGIVGWDEQAEGDDIELKGLIGDILRCACRRDTSCGGGLFIQKVTG
jgi:ATP-dependent protease HslVU (ClpYQ) peptidase subunit